MQLQKTGSTVPGYEITKAENILLIAPETGLVSDQTESNPFKKFKIAQTSSGFYKALPILM